jgi:xylulokinase
VTKALLGIDLGTSSVRAGLVTPSGDIVGTAAAEYPILTPRPGWAEQDPTVWWSATCAVIARALAQSRLRPADILAVGLSGQMHGLVLVDALGAPVRPAIIWPDARSAEERDEIERAIGRERLYRITGLPAATGFFAVSLQWVRCHEPEAYDRSIWALLPKDYIRYRLTGDIATDPTDASGTLLFDVAHRRWAEELVAALVLRRDLLPPLLEPTVIAGRVTDAAAVETGLAILTPVATGGGDQAMGAISLGLVGEGTVACTIGTGGQVSSIVRRPVIDPRRRLHTLCSITPGAWLVMGAMLSAGLSLRWFRDALGAADVLAARQGGMDPYALLSTEAERAVPGAGGLIFLPYLTGERTPYMDPDARGGFIGLSLSHSRSDLVRAVMEGVVFGMRQALDIFRELEVEVGTVISAGGGARSRLWRQIQADIYGMPVWTISREEHSLYGASLAAGIAAGVYRDVREATEGKVPRDEVLDPIAGHRALYERQYAVFQDLYPALRDTFRRLAEMRTLPAG